MSSPHDSKFLFSMFFLLSMNYIHLTNGINFNPKVTVVIRNNLPNNSGKLKYHVQSRDDDFGLHSLNVTEEFSFSFHENYMGTTLFYSHF